MAPKFSLRSLFAPVSDPSKNIKPTGSSGRAHFNGLIELDELNLELAGNAGRYKFDEMYWTDPDIRRLVLMVWAPIQAGVWGIDPYGGDEATDADREAAKLVEWALWEAMRPSLPGHLAEVGPMLIRQGFLPFEQIWMSADYDGKLVQVPRTLGLRLPRTIWKWYQDAYGQLTQIVQILPNAKMAVLDASYLTYYRVQAEGDNWEGRSLLRPAYKPWRLKDALERIDAIGQERKAVGVPFVYPPRDADPTTRGEVENILAAMHTSEVAYAMMPGPHPSSITDKQGDSWLVDVIKFDSSSGESIQNSLKWHRESITSTFLGDFMSLGHHQVGARATAQVQEDPFLTAVRAFGEGIAETLNESLVRRIVDLNCPNVEGYPKLTLTLEDDASLSELSSYVEQTVNAGVIHPDAELEDYLRERADLPPADAEARATREAAEEAGREAAAANLTTGRDPVTGEPTQGPGYQGKPDPNNDKLDSGLQDPRYSNTNKPEESQFKGADDKINRGTSRAPNPAYARTLDKSPAWYEQLLSQGEIKQALDEAKDRFAQAGIAPLKDFISQVVSHASTSRKAPDTPPKALTEALEAELDKLYLIGVNTVQRELADQHARLGTGKTVTLDEGPVVGGGAITVRRAKQRKAAQVAARNIARKTTAVVEAQALNDNATKDGLLALATRAGEAALKAAGQETAAAALNAGRADAASQNKESLAGAYYTSVLDGNTCEECESSDNGELVPVDSPEYEAESPPNPDCAGGQRCRCCWIYVLSDDPVALG